MFISVSTGNTGLHKFIIVSFISINNLCINKLPKYLWGVMVIAAPNIILFCLYFSAAPNVPIEHHLKVNEVLQRNWFWNTVSQNLFHYQHIAGCNVQKILITVDTIVIYFLNYNAIYLMKSKRESLCEEFSYIDEIVCTTRNSSDEGKRNFNSVLKKSHYT